MAWASVGTAAALYAVGLYLYGFAPGSRWEVERGLAGMVFIISSGVAPLVLLMVSK